MGGSNEHREMFLEGEGASDRVERSVVVWAEGIASDAVVFVFVDVDDALEEGAVEKFCTCVDAFAITESDVGLLVRRG
jgi:hypothetical protein